MLNNFKVKYNYSFVLLKRLVISDFKLRYQGSALGYLWSLLRPLAMFGVLYIVFVNFLKFGDGIPNFPIYLLLGIVMWNFFVELTSGAVSSIASKGDLIRKINFPKYVIVLASSVSALINFSFNMTVVFIFMIIFGSDPIPLAIIFIPILIVELYLFGLGIAFFLSATFVKYKDISYIWDVIVQAGFYATPILYPLSRVPEAAQKLLMLNPVAQILQDARYLLVTQTPPSRITDVYPNNPFVWLVPFTIVIVTFAFGSLYFKSNSKYFAEEV